MVITKPPLFFKNYNSDKLINVNQGGTSSGKTYTIVDMFFVIAMSEPNLVLSVVGKNIPNLKRGAYRDAKTIYNNSDLYKSWFDSPNETDRIFRCKNGSLIEFLSFIDAHSAKGGKRHYLFVNEANGIPYSIYWELQYRTSRNIYIDYNPTSRFWVHDYLIGRSDVKLIISDHRHNPFLSQEMHDRIESIEDKEKFRVYARGLTGKIEGLIFTNWSLVDSMPSEYKRRYIGIDFGFSNDPTSIVDVRLHNGELWIDLLCYETGLINTQPRNGNGGKSIEDKLRTCGISRDIEIIADCQEAKSIQELRNVGFRIEPSKKGNDSIRIGIDILRRYKLNITRKSEDLINELMSYKWREDKSGKPINKPTEDLNHALDAIRYVALNKFTKSRQAGTPTIINTTY